METHSVKKGKSSIVLRNLSAQFLLDSGISQREKILLDSGISQREKILLDSGISQREKILEDSDSFQF